LGLLVLYYNTYKFNVPDGKSYKNIINCQTSTEIELQNLSKGRSGRAACQVNLQAGGGFISLTTSTLAD